MTLPSIAAHARKYDITPQKKLGQNFIFDSSLCDKIVRTIPSLKEKTILEIGPGSGGLTRSILNQNPAKLIVIEKDTRCLDLLRDIQQVHPNMEIIEGDALKIKLTDLFGSTKIHIISNLPYNIGTELVFRWLEYPHIIEQMTLMLQKEVVDRICAKPGNKTYGKLSVMCQLLTNPKKEFDVSPTAFYPPPKVYSSIVSLVPKESYLNSKLINNVRMITHEAFTARRKMLRSSLKLLPGNFFAELKINPTSRAEDLTPEDYLNIANLI